MTRPEKNAELSDGKTGRQIGNGDFTGTSVGRGCNKAPKTEMSLLLTKLLYFLLIRADWFLNLIYE